MGYFAVDVNDLVFRIEADEPAGSTSTTTLGDDDTCIEIQISPFTTVISNIECVYLGKVFSEPNLWLPDIRSNPDLEMRHFPSCGNDCGYGERLPCLVNVVRNELDIVLKGSVDEVCSYHKDGRVEYYYSEDDDLLYIKVRDLTDEEYEFLSRWID
ncbi:MAG: hypothetical protein IJP11_09015 [Oscillospiraceae bacterium]|nr:hypothetical protein [Oscillospiraceae bacterium]